MFLGNLSDIHAISLVLMPLLTFFRGDGGGQMAAASVERRRLLKV